jgi:DNA repair exonuclease SbcCD ATPase subunit
MRLVSVLILLFSSAVFAQQSDVDAEIRQLQAQISSIQQEQQSVYQQFQMTTALRNDELHAANPTVIENSPVYSSDNAPPNYDDMVRAKAARDERIRQYTGQVNTLYARYQELEQQKQQLVARLRDLSVR